MPYLIRIGMNENNASRITCKGYYIRRSGRSVFVAYGPIDVVGHAGGKYYWAGKRYPQRIEFVCRTDEEAKSFAKAKMESQLLAGKKSGGYTKLPPGIRIRSSKKNPVRH